MILKKSSHPIVTAPNFNEKKMMIGNRHSPTISHFLTCYSYSAKIL